MKYCSVGGVDEQNYLSLSRLKARTLIVYLTAKAFFYYRIDI
ncbi:hypothetical protein RUA4292_00865 [Ruegeria atlantica]|uniref:Uncharacterized protein n=1 Tax=Ruegeria atlantica TaxID=81569 RepID=A0A0P1ECH5_9RHOB|nr:hypothetical protein RUA4292_00865 [Ruegeria atlantica]